MKKHFRLLFGLSLLAGALGCKTNVPMVRHHPATLQTKLQAVDHWRIMAQELAERIASEPGLKTKGLYVQPLEEPSSFAEAYRKLLISELMHRSVKLAETPELAPVRVSIANQLVSHGDREFLCNPTTIFSAIGLGVRNFFVGDGLGTDWQTREELLVTTQVHENEVLRLLDTQIVYVSPNDASLYTAQAEALSDWPTTVNRARAERRPQW